MASFFKKEFYKSRNFKNKRIKLKIKQALIKLMLNFPKGRKDDILDTLNEEKRRLTDNPNCQQLWSLNI